MPRSLAKPSLIALLVVAAFVLPVLVLGQAGGGSPKRSRPASAADPVVARVNGREIHRAEIDARKARGLDDYERETGRAAPPTFDLFFQRIALDEAVRERLLAGEARARGYTVSDARVDSMLQRDEAFRPAGTFDPARFAAYRRDNPKSYALVREQATDFLLFQRRAAELERELAPDAATLDRLVARRTDKLRIQTALVSDLQFDGAHDATDEELRAYYAKNRDAFAAPARLSYTALVFPADDGGRISAPGLKRAREGADALLADLRGGVSFDSAARRTDLVPTRGLWGQGQVSGVFARSPEWADSAFASPSGRVLPRSFEVDDGYAVVRVEHNASREVPRLVDITPEVRARWRAEAIEREARTLNHRWYDTHADSFVVPTRSVRWARVDTGQVRVSTPSDDELRTWFAAHSSEFARLDPTGGGVRMQPFEEARGEVLERVQIERRIATARALADRVAVDWARGKGGPGRTDGLASGGPAPLVVGGALPPGLRRDLADSALSWNAAPRAIVTADPRGFAVVGLIRLDRAVRAPFEAVEPQVAAAVARERDAATEQAARAHYAAHPERYRTSVGYAITYATAPPAPLSRVDVPTDVIERHYREHPLDFGTPAEVHVRHLLVGTANRSPADAMALATRLRARIVQGERLSDLARTVSDDPGSRERGGDLGWIRRGSTVPEFERAAFALTRTAPLSPPIRSEFGVHLLELVERRDAVIKPYEEVRLGIAMKLAEQYADTIGRKAAEALRADAKDIPEFLRLAEERKIPTALGRWYEGLPLVGAATLDAVRADAANTEPGQPLPGVYRYLQFGYIVAFLDSLLPARPLEYAECAARAREDVQAGARRAVANQRIEAATTALAAGRPWSEATETIGGTVDPYLLGYGEPLPGQGEIPGLDSALFGPDAAPTGGVRRLTTPRGELLLQVVERVPAAAEAKTREREKVRRVVLNRRIYDHVEELRAAARIEVLRPELAERPPAPPQI